MRGWADIDNPLEARCLLHVARHLERHGHDVLLTARSDGDTFAILREEGAEFEAVGADPGKNLARRLQGDSRRFRLLSWYLGRRAAAVDFVVTGSPSATLAARRLGIPSFVIADSEHAHVLTYVLSGSYILYPDMIEPRAFRARGVRARHLLPFHGLKEAISFSELEPEEGPASPFAREDGSVHVLVRPPEGADHHRVGSRDLTLELLRHLAESDATVVFSSPDRRPAGYLDRVGRWRREPVVLDRLPSFAVLKGVDAVVSTAGPMLREAAYLGVPAYSVSRGRIGAVDRHLASTGRLAFVKSSADFGRIRLSPKDGIAPLHDGSNVMLEVVETILARARRG